MEETVEEAAEKYLEPYRKDWFFLAQYNGDIVQTFKDGAAWKEQQLNEKMFTKEEIYQMYKNTCERLTNSFLSSDIEWFEQQFPK